MLYKKKIGKFGEDIALEHLEKHGWMLYKRNWFFPQGEIDLVMTKKQTLLCVEVKLRTSSMYGYGSESITPKKVKMLYELGQKILQYHPSYTTLQVDVILIAYNKKSHKISLKHIQHVNI